MKGLLSSLTSQRMLGRSAGCAAWARLAPGGRLVATAEDDHARAELLAFSAEVPAEAWQELSLSTGETVAWRLRFAPAAPVRLALWRKPR